MYQCDPLHPNFNEIARVTDYIVAYTCKGNESLVEEMKQMKALILGCQDITGTTKDVKKIAKKLLNKTTQDKIISMQECMCHVAKLHLYECSESIEMVNLSGVCHLTTPGESRSFFLTKYAKQETPKLDNFSLHQYFHYTKNCLLSGLPNSKTCIIPHHVGVRSVPTYPPTEGYAKSVLILHVLWIKTFNE